MTPPMRLGVLALTALAWTGCTLVNQDDIDKAVNADGDAFDVDVDCDDADTAVGSGTEWFADTDGDGLGDADASRLGCEAPADHVDNGDDCDDGDPEVGEPRSFFDDLDDDGFGDVGSEIVACEAAGRILQGGDCDDTDDAIHPEADEVCDAYDNDCDGVIDPGELDSDGDGVSNCVDPSVFEERFEVLSDVNAEAVAGWQTWGSSGNWSWNHESSLHLHSDASMGSGARSAAVTPDLGPIASYSVSGTFWQRGYNASWTGLLFAGASWSNHFRVAFDDPRNHNGNVNFRIAVVISGTEQTLASAVPPFAAPDDEPFQITATIDGQHITATLESVLPPERIHTIEVDVPTVLAFPVAQRVGFVRGPSSGAADGFHYDNLTVTSP